MLLHGLTAYKIFFSLHNLQLRTWPQPDYHLLLLLIASALLKQTLFDNPRLFLFTFYINYICIKPMHILAKAGPLQQIARYQRNFYMYIYMHYNNIYIYNYIYIYTVYIQLQKTSIAMHIQVHTCTDIYYV